MTMHPAVVLAQILFMTLMIGMPVVGLLMTRGYQSNQNTRIWFLAVVLDSLQIPLLALKTTTPLWWTLALPGVIPVMFFITLSLVLLSEIRESSKTNWYLVPLFGFVYTCVSSLIYLAKDAPDLTIQTFNNVLFLALSLLLTVLAFRLARKFSSRGMYFVFLGFAVSLPGYASRAWWHLVLGEQTAVFEFTAVGNFQIWSAALNLILMTFGYLGYVLERSDRERIKLGREAIEAATREELATEYNRQLLEVIAERDKMVLVNSRFLNLGALATFNSAIVHEISQPLAAIGMSLDNLKAQDASQGGKYADQITDAITLTNKVGEIVSALRQMMVTGNAFVERTDVLAQLRTILPIIKSEAKRRSVKFEMMIPDHAVYSDCNGVLLQRLFINLVTNAFDAFESAQTINPFLKIDVCCQPINGKPGLLLVIADNGPGLSDEELGTLFQAFNTSKPTGLGVGLSLADILLRKWRGRITAHHAETGTGLRFEIALPLSEH